MIEKALVAGGIRFGTLRAVDQVTESFSGDLGREIAVEDAIECLVFWVSNPW